MNTKEISKLLRRFGDIHGRLSIVDRKLCLEASQPIPSELASLLAAIEVDLGVIATGWGQRIGMPKLPDLPLPRYALPAGDVLPPWQARVERYVKFGANREIAEWSAYLQLIDSEIEALIEIHRPFLGQLERYRWLDEAISEAIIGPEVDEWKQERLRLEAWIDTNVPPVAALSAKTVAAGMDVGHPVEF